MPSELDAPNIPLNQENTSGVAPPVNPSNFSSTSTVISTPVCERQSLKALTAKLLIACQRGRATINKTRWRLAEPQPLPCGKVYYPLLFDSTFQQGLRIFLLEEQLPSDARTCAFGCKRDGKYDWARSPKYETSISVSNWLFLGPFMSTRFPISIEFTNVRNSPLPWVR